MYNARKWALEGFSEALAGADSRTGPCGVLIGTDAPPAAQMAPEMRRDQYEQDTRFSWPAPTQARSQDSPAEDVP